MRIENSNIMMQGSSYNFTLRSQSNVIGLTTGNKNAGETSVSTTTSMNSAAYREYSVSNVQIMDVGTQGESAGIEETESAVNATTTAATAAPRRSSQFDFPDRFTFRMRILEQLLEKLTGRKVAMRTIEPSSLQKSNTQGYDSSGRSISLVSRRLSTSSQAQLSINNALTGGNMGGTQRTLFATQTNTLTKSSYVSFEAQGSVQTSDGRSINLNLNFNVSQKIVQTSQSTIEKTFTDPLVIDFDGNLAQFENQTMTFDLDSDGTAEEMHQLSAGSGYLAIDKNGNGEIDNGSELFGPQSNNGYSELAKYDEDGNGWIDEADSVFDQLKIWYHDENGESHLEAIANKNIGAIYLGNVNTEIDMYADNGVAGKMRQSGFVLMESGESRLMHELDVSV